MIRHEMPALLVTTEAGEFEKSIADAQVSGRLNLDLESSHLQKSLAAGVPFEMAHMDLEKAAPVSIPKAIAAKAAKATPALAAAPSAKALPSLKALSSKDIGKSELEKALIMIVDPSGDQLDPNLVNTHGEQFSSDADAEVLHYVTHTGIIDTKRSPVHNPPAVVAGPENGFPIGTPIVMRSLDSALNDLCKGENDA